MKNKIEYFYAIGFYISIFGIIAQDMIHWQYYKYFYFIGAILCIIGGILSFFHWKENKEINEGIIRGITISTLVVLALLNL